MKDKFFELMSTKMTHEEIKEYLYSLKWEINEGEQDNDDEEIEDAEGYLRGLGYVSLEEFQQKINELFDTESRLQQIIHDTINRILNTL